MSDPNELDWEPIEDDWEPIDDAPARPGMGDLRMLEREDDPALPEGVAMEERVVAMNPETGQRTLEYRPQGEFGENEGARLRGGDGRPVRRIILPEMEIKGRPEMTTDYGLGFGARYPGGVATERGDGSEFTLTTPFGDFNAGASGAGAIRGIPFQLEEALGTLPERRRASQLVADINAAERRGAPQAEIDALYAARAQALRDIETGEQGVRSDIDQLAESADSGTYTTVMSGGLSTVGLPGLANTGTVGNLVARTGLSFGEGAALAASEDQDPLLGGALGGAFTGGSAALGGAARGTGQALGRAGRAWDDFRVRTANARASEQASQEAARSTQMRVAARDAIAEVAPDLDTNVTGTRAVAPQVPPRMPRPQRPLAATPEQLPPGPPVEPTIPQVSPEWQGLARRYVDPTDLGRDISTDPATLQRAHRILNEYMPTEFASSEATNRAVSTMRERGVDIIESMDDEIAAQLGSSNINLTPALQRIDEEIVRIQSIPSGSQRHVLQGRLDALIRFSDTLSGGELPFSQARAVRNAARQAGLLDVYAAINDSISSGLPPDLAEKFLNANMHIRVASAVRAPNAIGEQSSYLSQLQRFRTQLDEYQRQRINAEAKMLASQRSQQDMMAYRSEIARIDQAEAAIRQQVSEQRATAGLANDTARAREAEVGTAYDRIRAQVQDDLAVEQVGLTQMAKQFGRGLGQAMNVGAVNVISRLLHSGSRLVPPRIQQPLMEAMRRGTLPAVMWGLQGDEEFRGMMDAINENEQQGEQ